MTLAWRLTRSPETTTLVTDDISLSCCEFGAARALHDFSFSSILGSISWTFPCAVRYCILQMVYCVLTLTLGFGVFVCNTMLTLSLFAD